jgi:hypothetical protein
MKMDEKPAVVVLSSSTQLRTGIPNAIQKRLQSKTTCEVTVWDQGLFRAGRTPLQSFLKELMSFDAAILVLGDDDTRIDRHTGKEESVPRDNVIFELGACMARFSKDRTFMICPKSKAVELPSYFTGITQATYDDTRTDGRQEPAVSEAVDFISDRLTNTKEYLASLPAAGLAFGYFDNFVRPTHERFKMGEVKLTPSIPHIDDFCVHIVVPPQLINREAVQNLFIKPNLNVSELMGGGRPGIQKRKIQFNKYLLQLTPARDVSIYATIDETSQKLLIFDIPTTLMTVHPALDRLEVFWGEYDEGFRKRMVGREVVSFRRSLTSIILRNQLTTDVKVLWWEEFEKMAFESPVEKSPQG